MADEKKTVIIKIDLDVNEYTKKSVELNKQIASITAAQKELVKSGKSTSLEYQKNRETLTALNNELRINNKVIQDVTKANSAQAGSNDQLRAQLSVLTQQYNALSAEERDNTTQGKSMQAQILTLTETLKQNEGAVGDNRRKVGDYAGAVKDLKEDIKNARVEQLAMAQAFGVTSKEFTAASQKLGDLQYRLKEASEASKVFTTGSKFEQFGNSLRGVAGDLASLDFAGASEKAKTLINVSKSITFKEAIQGVKDFGQTIINLGKALLTNPFILITASVAALGAALYYLAGQTSRSVDAQVASLTKLSDFYDRLYTNRIKVVKAAGEETAKLEVEQLNKSQELIKKRIDALETLRGKVSGLSKLVNYNPLSDEQQKTLDELKIKYENNAFEIIAIRTAAYKKQSDDYKKAAKESLDALDDFLKKQKDKEEQAARERLEANRNLNRQIEDERIELIKDDEQREKAKAVLDASRRAEDITNSVADSKVKHDALIASQETYEKDVADIEKKYKDIRLRQSQEYDEHIKKVQEENRKNEAKAKEDELAMEEEFQKKINDNLSQSLLDALEKLEKYEQEVKKLKQDSYKATVDLVNAIAEIQSNKIEAQINDSERATNAEIDNLQRQADAGIITQQEFETKSNRIKIDAQKKEAELRKKDFENQKKLALVMVAIKTAEAVVNALASVNPYVAAAYVAIALATGAAQVAAINSQPTPAFAEGGLTGKKITSSDGKSIRRSNGDNILASVKTGEVILNERQQAALGGDKTFAAIGVPGFAGGGAVDGGAFANALTSPVDQSIQATNQALLIAKSLPTPVVIVQDINEVQGQVASVQDRASV